MDLDFVGHWARLTGLTVGPQNLYLGWEEHPDIFYHALSGGHHCDVIRASPASIVSLARILICPNWTFRREQERPCLGIPRYQNHS